MYAMRRSRHFGPISGIGCLVLCLSLSQSCARSEPGQPSGSLATQQKLPFHPEADQTPASEETHPIVSPDPKVAGTLPFGPHSRTLPSGTLLTVQLRDTLSAAKFHAGDMFIASVAAPLAIDGDRLIERGAAATGQIESVRARASSGYFQLRLNAITVEGRPILLQTASLFARATLQAKEGIRVQKGRRLTFRLISPATLYEAKSAANRQSPGPSTE